MCFAAQSTAPPPSATTSVPARSHQASSPTKHKKTGTRSKSKKTSKHGQQKIDSQRAREIQQALIREHYLGGEPSGVWDDATQKAMQKFQADNGWQDKTTPDSRALIKLGLGPDHQRLLNPESAMTAPHAQAMTPPASPSEDASGKSPQ
jgi:peptidoglycan hydrolase-like protein with peptidoglycan-binding domain